MSQHDLSFDAELRRHKSLYGVSQTGSIDDHMVCNAAQTHAHIISDAVFDTFRSAIQISDRPLSDRARYFIRFGALRRLEMIFFAWRNIVCTVPANRERPLELDESRELMQDLNTIYINIPGTLDNLAWALLHEAVPERALKIKDSQVGLFQPCIINEDRFGSIDRVPCRGVGARGRSWSPAGLAGCIRLPRRAA
jgi:hypothetical protein